MGKVSEEFIGMMCPSLSQKYPLIMQNTLRSCMGLQH